MQQARALVQRGGEAHGVLVTLHGIIHAAAERGNEPGQRANEITVFLTPHRLCNVQPSGAQPRLIGLCFLRRSGG